jgi:hypothetical protein
MAQIDRKLDETGTRAEIILPRNRRAADSRSVPAAYFVSQVLAEHLRVAPVRDRKSAAVDTAMGTYASGARIAVVRMPKGYRTTVVV